jgi:phenylacetate-CoA ligase
VGDLFRTAAGKIVWSAAFDFEFFKLKNVKQYQVIQKSLDVILVRLVRDEGFSEAHTQAIEKKVQGIMGPETRVLFEFPDHIPIAKSGKYRYSYSEVAETPTVHLSSAAE